MNQIEIYKAKDGQTQVDVTFEQDTVWLSQKHMAELFEKDTDTVGLHLKNIYAENELDENSTTELFSVVQTEGKRKVERQIKFYNLDAILSVGYRVNSKQGTQFRQWATQRLKEHLIKGYTINQKRLEQLQQVVNIIQQSGGATELSSSEAKGLLEIITNYTQSFILLNQFDSNELGGEPLNENITYEIDFEEAVSAIAELKNKLIQRKQASALFQPMKSTNPKLGHR